MAFFLKHSLSNKKLLASSKMNLFIIYLHFEISTLVYLTKENFHFCKCKHKTHLEEDNSTIFEHII